MIFILNLLTFKEMMTILNCSIKFALLPLTASKYMTPAENVNPIFVNLPFDTVIINPFRLKDKLGQYQYPTHDILGMVRDILDDLVKQLVLKGIIRKELRMAYYNLIDIKETKGLDIIHLKVESISDKSGAVTP